MVMLSTNATTREIETNAMNFKKKIYKNISFFFFFFFFSQGSNLHHQGIPVLWMH